jgi:Tol biopolymer transport system component
MPNGTRVVFRTRAGLRWIDTDGSGRSQDIPHTLVADYPQSVSPDGSTLLLMRLTPDMSADLEILSLRGDESQVRPFLSTSAYEGGAQFSPDGRWVAYSSDESGHMEVYVRPFAGPDRKQVSTQGGRAVRWNPNGKELFYRIGDKTMAVSVSGTSELTFSAPRLLFEQRYAFGSSVTAANYDVSPDGERFVMVKDESGSGRLNVVLNWTEELKRLVPTK